MIPILHTPETGSYLLYENIYAAIQQKKSKTGARPSLVKINRHDYQELVDTISTKATLGLCIDSVTVVSFVDMERGSFQVLP